MNYSNQQSEMEFCRAGLQSKSKKSEKVLSLNKRHVECWKQRQWCAKWNQTGDEHGFDFLAFDLLQELFALIFPTLPILFKEDICRLFILLQQKAVRWQVPLSCVHQF